MIVEVHLWGTRIGAVQWHADEGLGEFQYARDFLGSGIELSPLHLPLDPQSYTFPALRRESFHGLPGLLADSLPDRFGNAVLDAWLAAQGRLPSELNPVERLCYVGKRGMGALEYQPELGRDVALESERLDVSALAELADDILRDRESMRLRLERESASRVVQEILQVGTSAGGARAKAIIAWNQDSGEVRSGQGAVPDGFEHWLLKFDGVHHNRDRELHDPLGFGRVEYAYALMAHAAGIEMTPCHLLEEGGRAHFMTQRFDRTSHGDKRHMLTLGALAHFDYNQSGRHSYEECMLTMRKLEMTEAEVEQLYRRMVFNLMARNQDDHVKNIAFLMDRRGAWSLAPAYDLTFSYNPSGAWTQRHQMLVQGKADSFELADLQACADAVSIRSRRAKAIVGEVRDSVMKWAEFAQLAGVPEAWVAEIRDHHRSILA